MIQCCPCVVVCLMLAVSQSLMVYHQPVLTPAAPASVLLHSLGVYQSIDMIHSQGVYQCIRALALLSPPASFVHDFQDET